MNKNDFTSTIYNKVLETLKLYQDHVVQQALEKCYEQYYVYDENKQWNLAPLKKHETFLIPTANLKEEILLFMKGLISAIKENPYLITFFDQFDFKHMEISSIQESKEQSDQILYYILFGFTLDRFNCLLRNDVTLLEETINHFQKTRFKLGFYRLSNILAVIKLHSIQIPVTRFISQKKAGKIRRNFGKYILTFNIFEATLVDICTGHFKNALTTLPLMIFNPNFQGCYGLLRGYDRGRESRFSVDKNAVEMYSPQQKKWSDLYQVWNMAFVSQFPEGLYLNMKLFIPSVAHHQDKSGEYMHNRITALLLAMNYIDFASHYPRIPVKIQNIKIFPKTLTRLWGKINYQNSIDYWKSLKK